MSYLIIFIFIVLAGILVMTMKPHKTKKPDAFYQKTPIHIAIEKHNQCISLWNQVSDEANSALLKKQREIIFKQDSAANDALGQIVREFNKYSDDIADYLRRSNACIDSNDIAGSNYCVDRIQSICTDAKAMINSIKELNVTNVYEDIFDKNRPVHITHSAIQDNALFAGCVTRKALDARYKHLAKAFHPDNIGGDKAMFETLQKEYEEAKKLCKTEN